MKVKLTKIPLILILVIFLQCSAEKKSISFYVAGHTYSKPETNHLLYPPFIDYLENIKNQPPSFIVLTGDILYTPSKEKWSQIKEELNKLDIPIVVAPGNHDMGDRDLYKSTWGNADTSFIIKDNYFISIDNTKNGWKLTDEQQGLINQALDSKASTVFIFMHNVIWFEEHSCFSPNSFAGRAGLASYDSWPSLKKQLKESKKSVYLIAGDVGAHQKSKSIGYLESENIHLVTSGMGNGDFDNILKIDIHNKVEISVIPLSLDDSIQPIINFSCE